MGAPAVLVAMECSGLVRDALIAHGIDAMSADYDETERPGPHHRGDVRAVLYSRPWAAVVAHPPCTYLCRAGGHWLQDRYAPKSRPGALKGAARRAALDQDAALFVEMLNAPAPFVIVENPQMNASARAIIRQEPAQYLQPWQHGHGEVKRTGLWTRGGVPIIEPTDELPPVGPEGEDWRASRIHLMPPGPLRTKERSRTYPGIAAAIAATVAGLVL